MNAVRSAMTKLRDVRSRTGKHKYKITVALLLCSVLVGSLISAPFARAAIAHRSSNSGSNGTGSADLQIPAPAGIQVGDLLVATVAKRSTGAFTASGWTFVNSVTAADSSVMQSVYYKIAASGDTVSSSYFFYFATSAKATGGISRFDGFDTSNPIHTSNTLTAANPLNTNMQAASITTTVANTYVISSTSQGTQATFSSSSETFLFNLSSSGGGSGGTKITTGSIGRPQAASGATTGSSIQTNQSVAYVNNTVAITPAPPATLGQQAYRWFTNVDAMNFSTVTNNPTAGSDAIYAATNDTSFFYTTGYMSSNGNDWRIEKRNLSDGALVTGFGTSGVINVNVSASDDRAWGIDQDASYIYLAGQDASISSTNTQWRIEKRDKTTGALVSGFGSSGVVQSNPTAGIDTPKEIKVDGSFVYIAGEDNTGTGAWRIEKRDITTGALVSGFGTNGVIVQDFQATESEQIAAMILDANNIYVGGYDYSSGSVTNSQSRIQKRDKVTGALVTGFGTGGEIVENPFTGNSSSTIDDGVVHKGLLLSGGNLYVTASQGVSGSTDFQWRITKRDATSGASDTNFGSSGVINVNPSTAIDNPTSIRTDGTSLFVGGFDRSQNSGQSQWRVEKRNLTDGALVTEFGSGGVYTSNPSTGHDEVRDMVVAGNNIYPVGYDLIPGNYQMHIKKMSRSSGLFASEDSVPRAAQDTAATAVALNEKIRLRVLLKASTATLTVGEKQLKLQFAQQSGTCDTAFFGESWTDVTTTTAIAFWDNTALTGATELSRNIFDPTDGSSPIVNQTYVESNNFTNGIAPVANGSNGIWDLALYNRSSADGVTYCFRVVESSGLTNLSSYTVVPSLTTGAVSSVGQSNYRWLQNANSVSPGSAMAAQNTATSVATGTAFRLRQLLNQVSGTTATSTAYKLQSGEKVSTCGAASYVDVASPMGFFNNATPADDATVSSTANDPTPVSGSVTYQTYNENGAFSNPTQITSGNSGLWDFSLTAESGAVGKTYCFRVVTLGGAQLSAYDQYPEISFTSSGPTLDQQMRGGQSVINGTKTPITF